MSHEISWSVSASDSNLIEKIAKRAVKQYAKSGVKLDLQGTEMDLIACHANGCPLDLQKLLDFDDFNFAHDISGIHNCVCHDTGKLKNHFLPRCSA